MPITWRNVGSAGSGAAASVGLFNTAQRSLDSGFRALQNTLDKVQETDLENWDQIKENNTNAALDNLRKYATPEAYAAAQAAGVLAPDAALGAQVDRRAVAEAADNRLGILQDAALKTNEYTNSQRDQKDLPILSKYESQLLSLDPSSPIDNQTGIAILEQAKGEGVSEVGLSKLAAMFRTTSMENQEFKSGQEATAAQIAASRSSTALNGLRAQSAQLTLDGQNRDLAIDAQVGDFNATAAQEREQQNSAIEALKAQYKDDPVGLKKAVDAAGLGTDTVAARRQEQIRQISDKYGAAAGKVFAEGTKGDASVLDGLTAEQQTAVSTAVAAPELALQGTQAVINERIRQNPLAERVVNFVGDSSALYKKVAVISSEQPGEVEAVRDEVAKLIKEGVPLPIIDLALDAAKSTADSNGISPWNNKDNTVRTFVNTIMEDPQYSEQYTDALEIQKMQGTLNEDKIALPTKQLKVRDDTLKSLGVTPNTVSGNLKTIEKEASEATKKTPNNRKLVNGRWVN